MILIDRDRIATMIPHAGTMCLLDGVLSWDTGSIHCLTRRHRDKDNPMRRMDGTLGTACGIEIASQAMAVHGRLVADIDGSPTRGLLASVRDVRLRAERLDEGEGPLIVEAERLMGDAYGATYRFMVASDGIEYLGGRATVLFEVTE